MAEYKRLFLKYLRIKELSENRKIIQDGGVIEKVTIGPHNIEYELHINKSERTNKGSKDNKSRKNDKRSKTIKSAKENIDLLAISTSKSDEKQPCFIMSIIPGHESVLISLSRGIECFLDKIDDSTGIVLAALKIAKLKHAKTFEFTDNSVKIINGNKIRLADLSFLTTGKTWYERILPTIKMADIYDRKDIEDSRAIVLKNKWSDVYVKLCDKDVKTNFDTDGINISAEGSALLVLDRAKKCRLYAEFFQHHMGALVKCCGISSLHGKSWITVIE
jgi:hypothetical protein